MVVRVAPSLDQIICPQRVTKLACVFPWQSARAFNTDHGYTVIPCQSPKYIYTPNFQNHQLRLTKLCRVFPEFLVYSSAVFDVFDISYMYFVRLRILDWLAQKAICNKAFCANQSQNPYRALISTVFRYFRNIFEPPESQFRVGYPIAACVGEVYCVSLTSLDPSRSRDGR